MYFKTTCPKCKNPNWHDIHIALKNNNWENIYHNDTVSEEELAAQIIRSIRGYIRDGMSIKELCHILTTIYGIASNYCCDIIQRIKLELCLYSPDGKKLKYAN